MRIIVSLVAISLFATVGLLGTPGTSAATPAASAITKAATAASLVSTVRCRVVRRCSYFNCSYEEVCD